MDPTPVSALVVDRSQADAELMAAELRRFGLLPAWTRVETEEAFVSALRSDLDVVLADCALPQIPAARVLELLGSRGCDVPVIVIVESDAEANAAECLRLGAADYLFRDRLARLGPAVQRVREARALRAEKQRADDERSALLHALAERVKELTLLQQVAALLQNDPPTTPGLLQMLAALLPPAFRWPQIAAARVRAGGTVEQTAGFRETSWLRQAAFALPGGTAVSIEIAYVEAPPDTTTPFLREEESLLAALGDMLRAHFERRAAVDELEASREHFRRLIEHASDVVSVLSPEGIIRYESPAAGRVLGYPPEEMLGQSIFAFIHPDDHARVRSLVDETLRCQNGPAPVEFRFRHRDGRWLVLESVGTPLVEGPTVVGSVINTRDITERKTLEQQLRQAQKLEAVGRLAGGIAHDFNNLLTAIVGYADLLLASMPADDPHKADVTEIQSAGRRAAALTRQLLSFSRRQVIEPEMFDLNDVVRAMEAMLRRLIGEDIELVTELGATSRIVADAGQVDQVLMNLALNARDAMEGGGRLSMSTRDTHFPEPLPVRDGPLPAGHYVQLSVSDSGSGMTDEVKAHLFEPFFTTKEQGRGTGLGLATIYGIVKQAGGGIRVESHPGAGTTFDIFFPAAADRSAPDGATPPDAAGGGSGTILLVEDEDAVRALASTVLQRRGYRVIEAASGGEALEAAAAHTGRIDLLLTDVVMPEGGGVATAEELRTLRPALKVLFMTGNAGNLSGAGASMPGSALLTKPFSPRELERAVRELLEAPAIDAV